MTSETIAADPAGMNGAVSFSYDAVGNRTQKTSTLPGYPGELLNYNANDQLATDTYDADGNTVGSGANTGGSGYVYDFENRLIQQGGNTYSYDGDGNRVQKFVAGVYTNYLLDPLNPTGYAQVLTENYYNGTGPGEVQHRYLYGLERLSEVRDSTPGNRQYIFYVYDGHGSVRALTDQSGAVTDTYDYDAFGTLMHSTGTTYNNYLFAGEQFDPELGLYFNRARYLNASTGRFWNIDTEEASDETPLSLHKYLYASADPVNRIDPSGNDSIAELNSSFDISSTINSLSSVGSSATRHLTHFPFMAVQTGESGVFVSDSARFDFSDCSQCYGALRKYNYRLVDPRGVPFTERAHVTEIVQPLIQENNSPLNLGEADTVNGYFGDILSAANAQPIKHFFLKTEQTFRVSYNGQVFPLSTKVNQYIAKRNGRWDIKAVVVVP